MYKSSERSLLSVLKRPLGAIELWIMCLMAAGIFAIFLATLEFDNESTDPIVIEEFVQTSPVRVNLREQIEPILANAENEWNRARVATEKQVDVDLRNIGAKIDVSRFAEEMLGWTSKFQLLGGGESHRSWIRDRFLELVISPDDLRNVLVVRLQQLHGKLAEIDDELFVKLQADVEIDARSIPLPRIDLAGMDQHIEMLVRQAEESAWASLTEFAVSSGIGFVVGETVSSPSTDEGGQNSQNAQTLENQIFSFVSGVVIGLVTDAIVSTVSDNQGKLEEKLQRTVSELFHQLALGNPVSKCWVGTLERITEIHRSGCLNAISEQLGSY